MTREMRPGEEGAARSGEHEPIEEYVAAIGRLSKSHRRAEFIRDKEKAAGGGGSIFEMRKKKRREKRISTPLLYLLSPLSLSLFLLSEEASGLAVQSVGELFCSAV